MSSANVKELHQIFLWPLRIAPGLSLKEINKRLTDSVWDPETDRLLRGRSKSHLAYSEFVYFHPFAQRFLYQDKNDIKLYTRSNKDKPIKGARVYLNRDTVKENPIEVTFEHIHLYHFCEMALFILVVEISVDREMSLCEAEDFLDQFRRAYPPYWENSNRAGHCPYLVELFPYAPKDEKKHSDRVSTSNYWQKKAFMDCCQKHKQPSVANHWQTIMEPLSFASPPENRNDTIQIHCQHVMDDRIPHMAHLAVEEPLWLTKGAMVRLGLADACGSSDSLPYAEAFLEDFEKKYCYDRFWEGGSNPDEWKNTRYIITDYSFTAIGAWEKSPGSSFFCNPESGMLAHFRSHYFQMMLVAQMYRASLLSLADQLADTIVDLQSDDRLKKEKMHERATTLQHKLLIFNHRYWFTEISNQLQGKELFAMILQNQQTEKLYDQVKSASTELYEFMETEFQGKAANLMSRLTVLATMGLIASITLSFVSIVNIPEEYKKVWENWPQAPFLAIGAISFVALVILMYSRPLESFFDCLSGNKTKSIVGKFCHCLVALFPKKGNKHE